MAKKKIMVTVRYTACSLWAARLKNNIGRKRLASYLGINERDIKRFERGRAIIDTAILDKLFAAGIKHLEQEAKRD